MSEKLANRLTIAEVVAVYNRAVEQIRGGFAVIDAAETMLNETFTLDGHGSIYVRGRNHHVVSHDSRSLESVLLEIRHDVWSHVIERLEVRRMMSIRRWDEIQAQIQKRELPEITEESVAQLVSGFQQNLTKMLEEAVEEVFDWLRPPRSQYKTNSELEIGPKVILNYVVERRDKRWTHTWRVNYRYQQNLSALENVFTALDGRGQITKSHHSEITNVISAQGYDGVGETQYFKFRTFEKGTMHLWFKRADLLSKFNAIAGGRRLRPAAAAE